MLDEKIEATAGEEAVEHPVKEKKRHNGGKAETPER